MFKLQNINYSFPHSQNFLLKDINLHIPHGSMLAIMGLNGTGKTTFLKILSRFLKPISGLLEIDGRESSKLSQKELAQKIAFVPQDFPTDFPFKVFDFVMMGRFAWQDSLFNKAIDIEKVHQILARLKLTELKLRVISTLSGGERQRVLLARALVQESKTILLDEPVNHLDIKNKIEILKIAKYENQMNQKTIIAVMHDFHDVLKYFHQVIFFKDGKIQYRGDTTEAMKPELIKKVFEVDEV